MAHRLFPPEGRDYLPPAEVVERLRDEFAFVNEDRQQGADHVGDMIAQLLRMQAGGGASPYLDAQIEALEAVREEAAHVTLGDDPAADEAHLSFAVIPGHALLVGYSSGQHEDAAQPLLERCASALNYLVELV